MSTEILSGFVLAVFWCDVFHFTGFSSQHNPVGRYFEADTFAHILRNLGYVVDWHKGVAYVNIDDSSARKSNGWKINPIQIWADDKQSRRVVVYALPYEIARDFEADRSAYLLGMVRTELGSQYVGYVETPINPSNSYLTPLFDFETSKRVLTVDGSPEYIYHSDTDEFEIADSSEYYGKRWFKGRDIVVNGEIKHVYPIGENVWNWSLNSANFRAGVFTIDDNETIRGYTYGATWNGFACPYFDLQTCEAFFDGSLDKWSYDDKTDSIVIDPYDSDLDSEIYQGIDIVVNGEIKHVYPLGAWNWVWDEIITPALITAQMEAKKAESTAVIETEVKRNTLTLTPAPIAKRDSAINPAQVSHDSIESASVDSAFRSQFNELIMLG